MRISLYKQKKANDRNEWTIERTSTERSPCHRDSFGKFGSIFNLVGVCVCAFAIKLCINVMDIAVSCLNITIPMDGVCSDVRERHKINTLKIPQTQSNHFVYTVDCSVLSSDFFKNWFDFTMQMFDEIFFSVSLSVSLVYRTSPPAPSLWSTLPLRKWALDTHWGIIKQNAEKPKSKVDKVKMSGTTTQN